MDLTVSERDSLGLLACEVIQTHGDHSGLLFFDIYELDETFLTTGFEVPLHSVLKV